MTRKQRKIAIRIAVAGFGAILLNIIPVVGAARLLSFLAVYFVIGYDIIRKAALGIFRGRVLDENFLMAVATLGAFFIAIYDKSGDYNEAVAVMLFYQIGELFQSLAVGKSRKSISALMDMRPDCANIEVDGEILEVSPDEVALGSIVVVKPGERIPIDGAVVSGSSDIDTSMLTGESIPRSVSEGDEVISGSINLSGLLRIRTTKDFRRSTVSVIMELVENATARKARAERFITKFAKIYTPTVCAAALALGILVPAVMHIATGAADYASWIYRALTFLVISCPCALVISIPMSFFAGIGCAGREGILIKGSGYIEMMANIKGVVFDKTGTLTRGEFSVSKIYASEMSECELLELAAIAESSTTHPIGRSIVSAFGGEIDRGRVEKIEEISGFGVVARIDGSEVGVGNARLMSRLGAEVGKADFEGGVHVCKDGVWQGYITVSDNVKEGAREAVAELSHLGVSRVAMLTGDEESAAVAVARSVGITEYKSRLLPTDKVAALEEMLSKLRPGERLAFVGDGINDAPVLARADVGIAMGAMGSDAAIEAADVVLMNDDTGKIAKAIKISKKCISVVRENIIFSLLVKAACLMLVGAGLVNMWLGIFADVGVMILAVLNASRAFFVK